MAKEKTGKKRSKLLLALIFLGMIAAAFAGVAQLRPDLLEHVRPLHDLFAGDDKAGVRYAMGAAGLLVFMVTVRLAASRRKG